MKPIHSRYDDNECLQIACCECAFGGNGEGSCPTGYNSRKWDHNKCFLGELLEKYEIEEDE